MKKALKSTMVFFSMLISMILAVSVQATITYDDTTAQILENQKIVVRGSGDTDVSKFNELKKEMSFTDEVNSWYLVYPDAAQALEDGRKAGDVVSVSYQGATYDNVVVYVANKFNGTDGLRAIIGENTTIFFSPGEYITDKDAGNYGIFNKPNLSLIGLDDTPGNPSVSFDMGTMPYRYLYANHSRTPRTLISNQFYAANIIFDAKKVGMKHNYGTGGSGSNGNSHSSGEYFIHIIGNDVMFENVTIQNVSSNQGSKNVAINMIHAQRVVFDRLTMKDSSSLYGYAPIQINNSSRDIYFNDLHLDNVHGYHNSTLRPFLKLENGSTYVDELLNSSTHLIGNLSFENVTENDRQIYVENYRFDTLSFPSDQYPYAQLRNENGSWTTGYVILSQTMPESHANYAILDLRDNSFVVKEGDTISESNQIKTIIDTIAFIRKTKETTEPVSYNLKYEVDTSLDTIDLPPIAVSSKFEASYAGYHEGINFNIVPVKSRFDLITDSEQIEYNVDHDQIILPSTSADRYAIYNIDFDSLASLTMQEVIEGVDAVTEMDPNTGLYPLNEGEALHYQEYYVAKDKEIPYSSYQTFRNSKFTSLVNKIELTSIPNSDVYVGDTLKLEVSLTDTNDNSYTIMEIINDALNKSTSNDDVPLVKWYSNNPAVATVDGDGEVTAVGEGVATIVAKAVDEYNDGEIEKPWLQQDIKVRNLATVIVQYRDEAGSEIQSQTVLKGRIDENYQAERLEISGYTFKEWDVESAPESGKFTEGSQTVIYIYTKNEVPKSGTVIVQYRDEAGKEIKTQTVLTGKTGESYQVEREEISGYTFKEWDVESAPERGKFTEDSQTVIYLYAKNEVPKSSSVIVQYKDEAGNVLKPALRLTGHVGDRYQTVYPVIEGYTFKNWDETSAPASGEFKEENQTVVYVYTKSPVVPKPEGPTLPKTGVPNNASYALALIAIGLVIVFIQWRKSSKNHH